jgi:predicted transcriptional regulator
MPEKPPTERDALLAKRKGLEDQAKDLPKSQAASNPENIATGAIAAKIEKLKRQIDEIDEALARIAKEAKK